MAEGLIQQPSVSPSMMAQLAAQYGGTQALPQIQRSQYLAQALQALQQSGGQNLRTPLALGSNLLAEALLMHGRKASDQNLNAAIQSGQTNQAADAQRGIYAPPQQAAQPQAQMSGGVSIGAGPGGSGPTPDPAPAVSVHPLAAALSPQDTDAAVNTVYGEARGEPTAGRQAVAGVLENRAALTGLPIADIAAQPHQFAGFNPDRHLDPKSSIYQSILADILPVLNGQAPNPAGSADHFYAPGAMPNGSKPSWDNGTGQMIGNQDFLSLGYGGKPPLQQGQGAPPQAPPAQQPPTGSQPYQVASNGPTPPPPMVGSMPPQGAMPSAPAGPLPGGAGGPPPASSGVLAGGALQGGPPVGPYATPQEQAFIQERLAHPQGSMAWQQGVAKAQEIQQRAMTPMAPPKDMMWGPNGQAVPVPGMQTQTVSSGPAGATQADPFGKLSSVSNPNAGALPAGMVAVNGPNGPTLVPMGGSAPRPLTDPKERAQVGILPSDRNSYAIGPDGKVTKVADNPYGPKEIQSVHDNFWGSDETKKAQEAYSAYSGLTAALSKATGNSGPLDQAAIDSFLRGINPGMGARNSTVQMVMSHFGLPQELQGHLSSLLGNGFVTPQSLQQMLQVTRDYAVAHQTAAQARAQADAKMVAPYGYSATDLAEDLPSIGPVPQVKFGGAAPGPGVNPGNAAPSSGPSGLLPGLLPGSGSQGAQGGQAGGPQRLSPQQAAALPSGTHFVGLDGIARVKR